MFNILFAKSIYSSTILYTILFACSMYVFFYSLLFSITFIYNKCMVQFTERPRSPLALTPMLSVVIGLAAAIVIGGLAIILALRIPCGTRRKRKEITHGTTTCEGSPGPSDKSIGSKEIDGNESDEKNPDIIPDTMDSDDQVCQHLYNIHKMLFLYFFFVSCVCALYEIL